MIVIEANIAAALILPLPYSADASRQWRQWQSQGDLLLAPLLWEYEVASVLRRAVVQGILADSAVKEALKRMLKMGIEMVVPTAALHELALRWAVDLGQHKVYDAHYLALAESRDAEFWTADQRLVNGVQAVRDVAWVRLLGAGA